MRLTRLASLYSYKYKIAVDSAHLEASVRNQIAVLWNVPNKTHNILRACADSGASKPTNPREELAMEGYQFCKKLLSIIDYVKVHQKDIPLDTLKQAILSIIKLIMSHKQDNKFPEVNELIYIIFPTAKKSDLKERNAQLGKAATGLSRILSMCLTMLEEMKEIAGDTTKTVEERFEPARAPISENDIIAFIRQYGEEYGISSRDDWGTVFRDDPMFKEDITTVINALNRGHSPRDAAGVKMQIAEILKNHEARKSSNAPLFEDVE